MITANESLLLFGIGLCDILLAVSLAVVRTRPKQQGSISIGSPGFEATVR